MKISQKYTNQRHTHAKNTKITSKINKPIKKIESFQGFTKKILKKG